MSTGRSRGRARVRTDPQPQPVGALAEHVAGAAQPPVTGAPSPITTTYPTQSSAAPSVITSSVATPQSSHTRQSSPSRAPEAGRGRGLIQQEGGSTIMGSPSESTGTKSSPSNGSPSSQESPPQQHSPPGAGAAPTATPGRAALRGVIHQPTPSARADIAAGIDRMTIAERGPPPVRPTSYEQVLRTRPDTCINKVGTTGNPIKILCNYFEVLSAPNWELYQYHIDFNPPIDSKKLRLGLFGGIGEELFPNNKAFDGSTLYSLIRLREDVTERTVQRTHDQAMINIKIKYVNSFVPASPQFVHLFNLVFRRCLKTYGMKQIDRNYYDLSHKIEIPNYGLQLINGFATSIASYEQKLLLCVEVTNKLLHKRTVFDLMAEIYRKSQDDNSFREECNKQIVGRVIMTKYNNKTYRVDDINWDETPTTKFPIRGTSTPLTEYYKKQYNIDVVDRDQPLLINLLSERDKRRGLTIDHRFVPELCILTGVDDRMREDFRFKKEVEQFSKVGSVERCRRVEDFVARFGTHREVETELNRWKMRFDNKAAEIEARVLRPESLQFGRGVIRELNEKADWGGEMKSLELLKTIDLVNWIVIFPSSKSNAGRNFIKTYGEIMKGLGIRADPPDEVSIRSDDPSLIIATLKERIKEKTQMVVVIVSSKRKDRYDAIKRICCLETPVPSQVVTSGIIDDDRKRRSVVTKVAIQMNCKLGGEVWMSNIPMKNTMICGIDTYHDSQKKKSSVCAFIASSNENYTKFFSRATIQETHQELSTNLLLTFRSACEHYRKMNGALPQKIVIYRDGISDGQLSLVKEGEIPQLEKAFASLDPNYKPGLAVVIVKKRGNARFFTNRPAFLNPPCGTIIDSVITRKEWFDFYLISQHVTQGTVNPTHYNVVHDTMGLKPDHFQRLSFKLCHMYYNWPGTIRVPATCQYAHKLAFLVGQSLHKEHHISLSDKLFYL